MNELTSSLFWSSRSWPTHTHTHTLFRRAVHVGVFLLSVTIIYTFCSGVSGLSVSLRASENWLEPGETTHQGSKNPTSDKTSVCTSRGCRAPVFLKKIRSATSGMASNIQWRLWYYEYTVVRSFDFYGFYSTQSLRSDDQEGLVRSPITAFQHTCNHKEREEREERGEGERNDILIPRIFTPCCQML